MARQGLSDREVKRGRGGIRDIEFAVQLLQLVHGRPRRRAALARPRSTRSHELAAGGYVDAGRRRRARPTRTASSARSSTACSSYDEQQVHAIPADARRA